MGGGSIGSVLGGIVGSVVPGIGTAIGAGLGGALGSAVSGGKPMQDLTSGLMGYGGGSLFSDSGLGSSIFGGGSSGSSGGGFLDSIFGGGGNDAASGAASGVNWDTPNLTSAAQGAAPSVGGDAINWNNDLTAPGSSSTISKISNALGGGSNSSNSGSILGKNPLATLGTLAQGIGAITQSQANQDALKKQQDAQQQFNQNAYKTISDFTPLNRQLSVTPQTVGNLNNYGQAGYQGWNGQGGNQQFYNNVNPASYNVPAMKAGGKVNYATGGSTDNGLNSLQNIFSNLNLNTYGQQGGLQGNLPISAPINTAPVQSAPMTSNPVNQSPVTFADMPASDGGAIGNPAMNAWLKANGMNQILEAKAGGSVKNYASGGKVNYADGGQADTNGYDKIVQSLINQNQQTRMPAPARNPLENKGPSLASIMQAMAQSQPDAVATRPQESMATQLSNQIYPRQVMPTEAYKRGGGVKHPKALQISKTTQLTLPTNALADSPNPGMQSPMQAPQGIEGLPQGLAKGGLPRIMDRKMNTAALPMEAMPNRIPTSTAGMMSNRMNPNNPHLNLSPLRMMAHGGALQGPGGGQDDKIPAKLSAGEYIVPASVVSALGDGDNNHGASKLDDMVKNVRIHKSSANPANVKGKKGKLEPKAKPIVEYMKRRKVVKK